MSVPPGTNTSMASRLPIIFAIASTRLMAPIPFSHRPQFDVARSGGPLPIRPAASYLCRGCAKATAAEVALPWRGWHRIVSSPEVPVFSTVAGPRDARFTCLRTAR
jgi:hypothetical protein